MMKTMTGRKTTTPNRFIGMEYLVAEEVILNSRDEQIVFLEAFKEFNK